MSKTITLQDAMSIKNPDGSASFLDIRFAVLNNLSQGWYSYDMLTAADGEITGVGSVLYRIQHFPKSKAYNGQIDTQNLVVETKEVKIDTKDSIGYEIEDMDLAQIIAAPAIQATAASNVATSIKATKNAKMFNKINAFLAENPANTYYLPELVSESDMQTEQYRAIQKKILVKRTKMTQLMNELYVNIDPSNFFGIVAPLAHTNFEMLLTALNISTAAMDLIKFGIGGMGKGGSVANLGGTPFISDPFIGQNLATGASFNGDFAMDCSKNVGYLLTKDAIAYPSKWGKMQILPNPANLNSMVKAKWFTGFGILRPELICGFVKELYTNAENGVNVTAAAGESHTFQLVYSDCGNRVVTFESDSANATVSDAGLITGANAGAANVTIKVDGQAVKTIAVTVA